MSKKKTLKEYAPTPLVEPQDIYHGAPVTDGLTKEQRQKHYSAKEIIPPASSGEIDYESMYLSEEEAMKEAEKYPARSQFSTSACGSFAYELCSSIMTGAKKLSTAFAYKLRTNNSEGMWHHEVGSIGVKYGICAESLHNPRINEVEYNSTPISSAALKDGLKRRADSYTLDQNLTIDQIVYILNVLKKPVHLYVYSKDSKEYGHEEPKVLVDGLTIYTAGIRHFVTALPNSGHKKAGVKKFIIQDSSHFGKKYIRKFTEDWVKKRTFTSLSFFNFKYREGENIPHKLYKFNKDLKIGMNNADVYYLQYILQELGFFPANQRCTGYFGGITRQAVKDYQESRANFILKIFGLTKGTGLFLAKTREQINKEQGF